MELQRTYLSPPKIPSNNLQRLGERKLKNKFQPFSILLLVVSIVEFAIFNDLMSAQDS